MDRQPVGIGIGPKIKPSEPKRTPEEEHDLLYSRYMGLNAFRNMKRRTPTTPEVERSVKEKGTSGIGKVQTSSEDAMFLQGTCYGKTEEQPKAFSSDKNERQEFIDNNCSICPVKSGCLNYGLEHTEEGAGGTGVWGGTQPEERAKYRVPLAEGHINPLDTKWFPEYKEP